MESKSEKEQDLLREIESLKEQLQDYKEVVEAIRSGEIDALAINRNGQPEIFTLESTDFVYRVLVENFAEGALNVSETGLIVYANSAFENLIESTNASIIGTHISALFAAKSQEEFQKLFQDAFSGNSKGELILTYNNKNIPVYISLSSLYPRFPGIGMVITDLSEKKKHELEISNQKTFREQLEKNVKERTFELVSKNFELQRGKEFIEAIVNASDDVIIVFDTNMNFLSVNNKFEKVYNKLQEDVIGKPIHFVFPKTKGNALEANIQRALQGEYIAKAPYESPVLNHWFQNYYVPLKDLEGKVYGVVMIAHDITDIVKSTNEITEKNKQLNETQSFLTQVMDSSVEIIIALDRNMKFLAVNKRYEELMQTSRENIIGKHLFEINKNAEGTLAHELILKAFDGKMSHLDKRKGLAAPNMFIDTYFIPLVINGINEGVLIMSRDVTEIVRYEKRLEKKNRELENSNKELESFNYIASHDLQEPLRKIQTFSGLILDRDADKFSEKTKSYFEIIRSSSRRMQNLIKALLNYSRISASEMVFEETDLNELVKHVKKDFADVIENNKAEINVAKLPTIKIIPIQFSQLFYNLIENSIKYSKKNTKAIINVSCEQVKKRKVGSKPKADYWKIIVSDNGIGFSMDHAARIFDLFQRLHNKDAYEGTGIGLAICKKIVENHNGIINAVSKEGEGATFEIFIPKK